MSTEKTHLTDQVAAIPAAPGDDGLLVFFAIGVAINLVLITAYFIWAYKQWKKPRPDDES